MSRTVVLVNPNKIHPAITPYALDILTTSLEQHGFAVEVVDLCFRRDDWRQALAEYFTTRPRPLLIGVTIRNTDSIYPQEQRVFLTEHREIIAEIQRLSDAPVVAGGIGFSSMPFACVDYFGIEYGVKGPGETILVRLAEALASGEPPDSVPGLLINRGGGNVERVPARAEPPRRSAAGIPVPGFGEARAWQVNTVSSYVRRSRTPWRVDNLAYYQHGGLGNILTKNGCPLACTHCVEPDAKGTGFAKRAVWSVVDEIESLVDQGVYDLHSTDSEFNLAIANSKALLREIVRRKDRDPGSGLHRLRLWVYSQPAPFDEEFADLLAAAGCAGVNVAPDHVREEMLDGWKVTSKGTRYYRWADTERVAKLCRRNGMLCMVEVLAGMPGETWETLRECIDQTLALDTTVVGFTLGLRCFPYSPLGMEMAARSAGNHTVPGLQSNTATGPIILKRADQCASTVEYERQFIWQPDGRLRPVYYFSPGLPEDPETIGSPNGRWLNTLQRMWSYIDPSDHPRVMLPTAPGLSINDNNYADNPFLTVLAKLGYRGAFWARWRERDQIMEQARAANLVAAG